MSAVKVPADVELEDKLAFGLTARQLALLAGSGVCAYGAYLLLTRSRSRAGRARRAAACRRVWAGARARTPRRHERRPTRARRRPLSACAQATGARPRRPPRATRPLFARVTRRDARHPGPAHPPQWARPAHRRQPLPSRRARAGRASSCAARSSRPPSSTASPASSTAARSRFSSRCAANRPASPRTRRGSRLPPTDLPRELAAAAREHAVFLRQLAHESRLLRRRIVLVLGSPQRDPELASASLTRQAAEATQILAGAEVALRPLSGEQAASLLAASLDPPGPTAGSDLEGVIHATSQTTDEEAPRAT